MRPEEVDTVLERMAHDDAWPPTPPIAASVRKRVERRPQPTFHPRRTRTSARGWRRTFVAAAATALALTVALSISGTVRTAVADLLGVVGIRIGFSYDGDVSPRPHRSIRLGKPVSQATASHLAGFDIRVPTHLAGPPSFHYTSDVGVGGMVSVAYPRSATRLSEVDVLVTEFAASVDDVYLDKQTNARTAIKFVSVGAEEGYWLSGAPHILYKVDSDGAIHKETVRLAGNVLLWEEGGITYRIEGAPTLAEAMRIARSLR